MSTNKQRREAARRHLERQLERRRQAEARRRRATTIISAVCALVLVAVVAIVLVATSGDDSDDPTVLGVDCAFPTSGQTAAKPADAPLGVSVSNEGITSVLVDTTQGQLVFALNREIAPCTVSSFLSLASQQYYDSSPCHRVNTSSIYVLQCGDPTGTGTGGPGYTIPDEYTGKEKYTRGTLAMANTGAPDTGGGQFFIVYQDNALPASYTVFGSVTSGMEIVDKVAAGGSNNANGDGDGAPNLPITINSISVLGTQTAAPSPTASTPAASSSPAN